MRRIGTVVVGTGLGLVCILVAGCGGGDDTAPPAASATPTFTQTPTATLTRTSTSSSTPTSTLTATPTRTHTSTATNTATATHTATNTQTATTTPTSTDTPTATPSPTNGPLGTRHFVINPTKSQFQVLIGANNSAVLRAAIRGQTNGVAEEAFMDLEAGEPDANGFTTINITRSSEWFTISSPPLLTLCLKPEVPVTTAGLLGCKGGAGFSIGFEVNHKVGQVGQNGFTVDDCRTMGGSLEGPNQICAAGTVGEVCRVNSDCNTTGASDGVCGGLRAATCTSGKTGTACQADGDCDTPATDPPDGACGNPDLHPGVCNGASSAGPLPGDTGIGEVVIAPFTQDGLELNGLPVRLIMENALPCGDEGTSGIGPFAMTSGTFRSTILNTGQDLDQTRTFEAKGQNFNCGDWQNQNGPGRLVLSAPLLDVPQVGDIITTFAFDGSH